MDFRSRLRAQIEYVGLLDKEVAEKAGISKHAMDTYVGSRACMPSADVAVRLAKVLGVSVEWLVSGEESSPVQNDIQILINYYSNLSKRDKKILISLAKNMTEEVENERS